MVPQSANVVIHVWVEFPQGLLPEPPADAGQVTFGSCHSGRLRKYLLVSKTL